MVMPPVDDTPFLQLALSVAPENVAVQVPLTASAMLHVPPSSPKIESSFCVRVACTCRLRFGNPDGGVPACVHPPVAASARSEPTQLPPPPQLIIQSPPTPMGSAP